MICIYGHQLQWHLRSDVLWRTESLGFIKIQTTEDYTQGISFLESAQLIVHNNQIYAFNGVVRWDNNYPNNLIYATYNGEEWSYTSESWGDEKIPQYIYNGLNLNNFSTTSLFEYNGEIHSFKSNLHSVLNDSYLNTDNANVVTAYPNLKYTLNQSILYHIFYIVTSSNIWNLYYLFALYFKYADIKASISPSITA